MRRTPSLSFAFATPISCTTSPPSHHVIVPSPEAHAHEIDGGDKKGVKLPAHRDVPAKDLQPGDLVLCSDGEPRKLHTVREIEKPDNLKVLKISFSPDLPVAVFKPPLTILTKGNKKQRLRRGRKSKPGHGVLITAQAPVANGEMNDYIHNMTVKNTFISISEFTDVSSSSQRRSSSAPIRSRI
mmetsp:Transcript_6599/g.16414  ORF Transcript_6599/g.16414 Transcript_6599/m.16414 type:complete len:184 (-) Transcript_6599:147-698(-)